MPEASPLTEVSDHPEGGTKGLGDRRIKGDVMREKILYEILRLTHRVVPGERRNRPAEKMEKLAVATAFHRNDVTDHKGTRMLGWIIIVAVTV
jgi:hypothetical protein